MLESAHEDYPTEFEPSSYTMLQSTAQPEFARGAAQAIGNYADLDRARRLFHQTARDATDSALTFQYACLVGTIKILKGRLTDAINAVEDTYVFIVRPPQSELDTRTRTKAPGMTVEIVHANRRCRIDCRHFAPAPIRWLS